VEKITNTKIIIERDIFSDETKGEKMNRGRKRKKLRKPLPCWYAHLPKKKKGVPYKEEEVLGAETVGPQPVDKKS